MGTADEFNVLKGVLENYNVQPYASQNESSVKIVSGILEDFTTSENLKMLGIKTGLPPTAIPIINNSGQKSESSQIHDVFSNCNDISSYEVLKKISNNSKYQLQ